VVFDSIPASGPALAGHPKTTHYKTKWLPYSGQRKEKKKFTITVF